MFSCDAGRITQTACVVPKSFETVRDGGTRVWYDEHHLDKRSKRRRQGHRKIWPFYRTCRYAQARSLSKAKRVYKEMLAEGVEPNVVTLSHLVMAQAWGSSKDMYRSVPQPPCPERRGRTIFRSLSRVVLLLLPVWLDGRTARFCFLAFGTQGDLRPSSLVLRLTARWRRWTPRDGRRLEGPTFAPSHLCGREKTPRESCRQVSSGLSCQPESTRVELS